MAKKESKKEMPKGAKKESTTEAKKETVPVKANHKDIWNSDKYKKGMMFFIAGAIIEMIGIIIMNKAILLLGLFGIFTGTLIMFNSIMKLRG
jgi:hypothetical protein